MGHFYFFLLQICLVFYLESEAHTLVKRHFLKNEVTFPSQRLNTCEQTCRTTADVTADVSKAKLAWLLQGSSWLHKK